MNCKKTSAESRSTLPSTPAGASSKLVVPSNRSRVPGACPDFSPLPSYLPAPGLTKTTDTQSSKTRNIVEYRHHRHNHRASRSSFSSDALTEKEGGRGRSTVRPSDVTSRNAIVCHCRDDKCTRGRNDLTIIIVITAVIGDDQL